MAEPIPDSFRQGLNAIADILDQTFNGLNRDRDPKIVFTLMMAETGLIEENGVNYISNGNREDMIAMIKEWLARIEGRYVEPPKGGPAS